MTIYDDKIVFTAKAQPAPGVSINIQITATPGAKRGFTMTTSIDNQGVEDYFSRQAIDAEWAQLMSLGQDELSAAVMRALNIAHTDDVWKLVDNRPENQMCVCGHPRFEHDGSGCAHSWQTTADNTDECPCIDFRPAG